MLRKLHLWLGLLTGIVIFIVSITGCIYVFIEELRPIVYKDRTEIAATSGQARLPMSSLKATAVAAVGEGYPLLRVIIPNQSDQSVCFEFQKINRHAWDYPTYMEFYKKVYLNPYSGEVIMVENAKWEFFNVIMWIHISLLFGYSFGAKIVMWSVVIFVFMLLSGLVLWWPKNRKSIKNRLFFRWKPRFRWRRKNFDLHAITGFYISTVALLMALTGLFWAFEWFSETVRWAANGGKTVERSFPESKFRDSGSVEALDEVENYLYANAPGTKIFMIRFPGHETSPFVARAYPTTDKNYNRTTFYFDQYSGEALKTESFETVDAGEKVNLLNYDLHVGSILGLPGKILAFFASLLSASLPVTGFLIWWGKRRSNSVSIRPASVAYSPASSKL